MIFEIKATGRFKLNILVLTLTQTGTHSDLFSSCVRQMLDSRLIEYTIPGKPNNRRQKHRIISKGQDLPTCLSSKKGGGQKPPPLSLDGASLDMLCNARPETRDVYQPHPGTCCARLFDCRALDFTTLHKREDLGAEKPFQVFADTRNACPFLICVRTDLGLRLKYLS